MGVSAEFILVPKADLGFLFILSKTDSWLKRFGRWGLCQPKAHLSGNVQRSWGEDFWVGYTWPRHKLGNLISKWSWPVSTETVCNGIILYMYHRYKSKGISKKALGLGIGAGFLGGAALGVAGGMATASVYQRYYSLNVDNASKSTPGTMSSRG